MSLRINLNSAAMNTHRQLQINSDAMANSIEKLSSGFKINRASDDPSGLVNSENMRAQISGLGQAISNSNDGVNMIRTAEGAMTEVHNLLRSMRTLAVHAANTGANNTSATVADQQQIAASMAALNRISQNTKFGDKSLLNGSAGKSAINLNSNVTSVSLSNTTAIGSGAQTLVVDTAAAAATKSGTTEYAGATAVAARTASVAAGTTTINGTNLTFTASNNLGDVVDAINGKTGSTGVSASIVAGSDGTHWKVKLDQTSNGSDKVIQFSETASILNGGVAALSAGTDAAGHIGNVMFNSGKGDTLKSAAGDTIALKSTVGTGSIASAFSVSGAALNFQIGAYAGQTASISIGNMAASALGIANIDVTSDAAAAITALDGAIESVSTQRASLGAFQKEMESNVNSLGVAQENISSSESAIRDTDMASEMANFTRNQIMVQAGTSMLTQANQAPQALLSLLK